MGDSLEQRFAGLVQPHFAVLYRAALRLTRRRPDAEDLVQEVCLKACTRLDDLAAATSPRAWLLRALYHQFVDATRRRGCNAFEPLFAAWAKALPPDVRLDHVPAAFRADFGQYARAYYAAEALGVAERAHQAVYDGIHRSRTLPIEGERPDEARIARFYAEFGVDAAAFLAAMQSFGVDAKVKRATEYMQRNRIPSTPSLVVNGRYLVGGESYADMLRIAAALIEKERAAHR